MADKYFRDIVFVNVIQHFLMSSLTSFETETNSLEYLSTGHVLLETGTGVKTDLQAPVLFWMRKGCVYTIRVPESSMSRMSEHIYTDFIGPRAERIVDFLEQNFPNRCLVPSNPQLINEIFSELLRCFRSDPEKYHARMAVCMEKLMLQIVESAAPKNALDDPYGIDRFAEMIRSDPFREFDIHTAASKMNISCAHFRRIFKERTKQAMGAYIRNQRMCRAAELLRKTNSRIKEIAYTCHFDSLMEFSRSFRRYAGVSPHEYRARLASGITRHGTD